MKTVVAFIAIKAQLLVTVKANPTGSDDFAAAGEQAKAENGRQEARQSTLHKPGGGIFLIKNQAMPPLGVVTRAAVRYNIGKYREVEPWKR